MKNEINVEFSALSCNESFARTVVAAFLVELNPTVSELMEVKTAVSEAVTNAIIHGYENKGADNTVRMKCSVNENIIYIEIIDYGSGIENLKQAMEPLYTSKPEQERSGMGFAVMENFMDEVAVFSEPGKGTTIKMSKTINNG